MSQMNNQGGQAAARRTKQYNAVKKMVLMAVFAALAFVAMCVLHIKVSFLTFDAKDAIITLASMLLGPVAGVATALVTSLIEMITVSDTKLYGFIMNFASSATFAAVAGLIYRKWRTMNGAIIALLSGVLSVTAVMMLLNILVTPHFMGASTQTVVKMIPTLLLPFNLVKSLLNAGLVLMLYRPVSVALHRTHILPSRDGAQAYAFKMDRRSVLTLILGLALVIACVVILLVLMHGSFQPYRIPKT